MNEHELHTLVSEAVKNNDIVEVRVNLVKCLFDKPAHNFRLFETEFKNAEKVLPNLVDEHDGEVFKSEEEWTKAYRNEQRHKLEVNFSEKRIIPLPLLKLCDLMEVLKAFVCNPDSWAFVTSDN